MFAFNPISKISFVMLTGLLISSCNDGCANLDKRHEKVMNVLRERGDFYAASIEIASYKERSLRCQEKGAK